MRACLPLTSKGNRVECGGQWRTGLYCLTDHVVPDTAGWTSGGGLDCEQR